MSLQRIAGAESVEEVGAEHRIAGKSVDGVCAGEINRGIARRAIPRINLRDAEELAPARRRAIPRRIRWVAKELALRRRGIACLAEELAPAIPRRIRWDEFRRRGEHWYDTILSVFVDARGDDTVSVSESSRFSTGYRYIAAFF